MIISGKTRKTDSFSNWKAPDQEVTATPSRARSWITVHLATDPTLKLTGSRNMSNSKDVTRIIGVILLKMPSQPWTVVNLPKSWTRLMLRICSDQERLIVVSNCRSKVFTIKPSTRTLIDTQPTKYFGNEHMIYMYYK